MSRQTANASMIRDDNSQPVQVLAADSDGSVLSPTASTARVAIPSNCSIVEISCLTAVHIKFGDNTVNATTNDRPLPAGAVVVYAVPRVNNVLATNVAFILATGATTAACGVFPLR
jgi:hypothetical protein